MSSYHSDAQLRLVRFAGLPVSRWANGAGTTVEIARDRPGSEAFDWRVSIASETTSEWFSPYEGFDRTLVNVRSEPLEIEVNGSARVLGFGKSTRFSGEDHVRTLNPSASASALNLMTRRSACRGDVHVATVAQHPFQEARGEALAIVVLRGGLLFRTATLGPWDALVGALPSSTALTSPRPSETVLARICIARKGAHRCEHIGAS